MNIFYTKNQKTPDKMKLIANYFTTFQILIENR